MLVHFELNFSTGKNHHQLSNDSIVGVREQHTTALNITSTLDLASFSGLLHLQFLMRSKTGGVEGLETRLHLTSINCSCQMSTVCLLIPKQLSRSGSNAQSTPPGVHGSHHGPTLTLRIKPFHRIEDRVSIMATCWNHVTATQTSKQSPSSPSLAITLASFPGLHAQLCIPRFETKPLRDAVIQQS